MLVLLYGCTSWTLTKMPGEKARSCYQHLTKELLYGHFSSHKPVLTLQLKLTFINCVNTGCRLEALLRVITNKNGWWERESRESVLSACLDDDNTHTSLYAHTHTHIYLIEYNWHFLSTYLFVNPFELPYWSYDIRRELVDKSSIISYFPSTFYPTLGHHQRRMYYKSDITFVCTLLLCKKKSVCTVVLCSVYFLKLVL